jgi:AAHS family benzoate transporter-like MFS transporter
MFYLPSAGPDGWRNICMGTSVFIIIIPFILVMIPDSMSFWIKKGKQKNIADTLTKVDPNFVPSENDEYFVPAPPIKTKVNLVALFHRVNLRNTTLLSITAFFTNLTAFALTTWVAQLMVQRGFTLVVGLSFLLVYFAAGTTASVLSGLVSDKIGGKKVMCIYLPVLFVSVVLIGFVNDPVSALICMIFAGFTATGVLATLLGFVGFQYPLNLRLSGMSFVFAVGRTGAIVGPTFAGLMVAAKMSLPTILVGLAAPSLLALITLLFVKVSDPVDGKLSIKG